MTHTGRWGPRFIPLNEKTGNRIKFSMEVTKICGKSELKYTAVAETNEKVLQLKIGLLFVFKFILRP